MKRHQVTEPAADDESGLLYAGQPVKYRYKTVSASRRRAGRVVDRWLNDGWELLSRADHGRRVEFVLRRPRHARRWRRRLVRAGLTLCLVLLLLTVMTPVPVPQDPLAATRAEAALAVQHLGEGDVVALARSLAANRDDLDFAYYFTVASTPRVLGDFVADAGASPTPILEPDEYEAVLVDLAGTLALASYGTADRMLPPSWAEDFIAATTDPGSLYREETTALTVGRSAQDTANKQNLLLLLSRGYWSMDFLKLVTRSYWEFDLKDGAEAWPGVTDEGRYAPAPNGAYLTDGVVALTAALTANGAASDWAFTEFLPGTKRIDGTDYEIGSFTHYLLFEHEFPQVDGDSIGITTVTTALSSAIDAGGGPDLAGEAERGPLQDTHVLGSLANDVEEADKDECSWNPLDYDVCVKEVVGPVARWVQKWGHQTLQALSLLSAAPNTNLRAVGIAAGGANSLWYFLEGDYELAGVSLAAVVAGLGTSALLKRAATGRALPAPALRGAARIARDDELASAGATRTLKSPKAGYPKEKEAENYLAGQTPGSGPKSGLDPGCTKVCSGKRNVDVFDETTARCLEVKQGVGMTNWRHEQNEVAKDVRLRARKICKLVEWHFFPGADGKVGPYGKLRELLQKERIPYVRHMP
ncbi:hypothetical protein NODU109028_17460 [Nocardioides dubius]|uniref:Tox-REase-5 domain-containing protein n=1 Tax=Nocardioides dubius TaxID=317019 RepID=A0ABP4E2S5_9ACTN